MFKLSHCIQIASESGRETPDYRLVQKSITLTSLSPGNSSAVSIEIVDDNRKESNETFSIHLNTSDPGVFIKVSNVRVTIIDNDCKCIIVYCKELLAIALAFTLLMVNIAIHWFT